jgi:F-type H+-transporting ATPase subunit b
MKIFFGIILAFAATEIDLNAAKAGMPQLDPKYWASQAFWLILVFTSLYLAVAKLFIPKIKNNLDDRDHKIKSDLDEANNLKNISEKKQIEYEKTIEEAKKEVQQIIFENKKKVFEKEINEEIEKAQKEINTLKKNSSNDIIKISEKVASKIIEDISGEKLNESSIKAVVTEVSKNNLEKNL